MIITDSMGHLVSTKDAEELHSFARRIGLKRKWYQTKKFSQKTIIAERHPEHHAHYDLTTIHMRSKAIHSGAKLVEPKNLIIMAWWAK